MSVLVLVCGSVCVHAMLLLMFLISQIYSLVSFLAVKPTLSAVYEAALVLRVQPSCAEGRTSHSKELLRLRSFFFFFSTFEIGNLESQTYLKLFKQITLLEGMLVRMVEVVTLGLFW